jgi:hypothetical protein
MAGDQNYLSPLLAKFDAAVSLDQAEVPRYLEEATNERYSEHRNRFQLYSLLVCQARTYHATVTTLGLPENAMHCTHPLSFRLASGTFPALCPRSLV